LKNLNLATYTDWNYLKHI